MLFRTIFYGLALSFGMAYVLCRCLLKNADIFRIGKRVFAERVKLHGKGIPRLGGAAIYLAFYGTLLFFYFFNKNSFNDHKIKFIGIFLASTLLMVFGLYDDIIKRLSYKMKFASQILAALIVIIFGYNINTVTNPFDGRLYLGILGVPFVILWMVVIINAVNFMDGLDGLACGITIIVGLSFFIIEYSRHNIFSLMLITSLLGAALAFLRYNFYPAKLFLGDSGSFFLGFMLGLLAIESSAKRAVMVSLIVPLLTLFIPLGGIIFTFSRRIAYAKNPFRPDTKHLHYRLLQAGVSHRDTVLIYYTATFIYAALGSFCFFMPKKFELLMIIFAVITILGFYAWAFHFVNIRGKNA